MQSGARTSASIALQYFARIDAIDVGGPAINAIIERNPDALEIAEALDRERREKGARGPLHGIPVVLKDNIDTADRMRTSAGSLALAEAIAARDAFVVERLRVAGCVILGKTNLSEWANFRGARSTSGWSARGGQTRNPYALDRNTSGSSSGSAAAMADLACRSGRWYRDRRVHRQSGIHLRSRRSQAHGGSREPRGHHSDRAQPGYCRTDGAHGRRRRNAAGRDDRRGSARRSDGGQPREGARRLHEVARSGGIERRAHRRRARVLRKKRPRRPRDRGGAVRDEGRGGSTHRSRSDPSPGRARRVGIRSPAIRIQGGPRRVPAHGRGRRARTLARQTSSSSTSATPLARCRTSGRSTSSLRRRRGR